VEKGVATGSDRATPWGEHLFFEPRKLSTEAISEATFTIRLMDKGFFRDCMIGEFEIGLS